MREWMKSAWLIAAAVLIPLLLFIIFQSGFAAREERRTIESSALSEARSMINTMTMRQNSWTLGTYCESYDQAGTLVWRHEIAATDLEFPK